MPDCELICIVDDDPSVCEITCRVLESSGEFECVAFTSPQAFLEEFDRANAVCVITDLKMPRLSGLELQQRLSQNDPDLSIVIVSGHADVRTAVQAMQRGAVTLLEKPYQPTELIEAVRGAVARTKHLRQQSSIVRMVSANLEKLTSEERDVLECMVAGMPNKAIAQKLALSSRTLDRRRQTVLRTMDVASAEELAALIARVRSAKSS